MAAQVTSGAFPWQETGRVVEATDDFATLESVVREHARFVFRVAYGVLRNSHDAEDVVQEVYLRVHRSGIKEVADIRAWLARVTFRLAIDRVRQPHALAEYREAGKDGVLVRVKSQAERWRRPWLPWSEIAAAD